MDTVDEPEEALKQGVRFGAYQIVRLLGKGGMGAVYEARHVQLGKRVAIKTLHQEMAVNSQARTRFLREGQAASKIDHPHVVSVSDVGVRDGVPYLVMEYLDGHDLGAEIHPKDGTGNETDRPLSVARTVEIMAPVCAAVSAAHRAGVVHRDLKPDNIYLARNPLGQEIPKVLDFGISKMSGPGDYGLTGSAALMGTPYYMSPEQAAGAKQAGPPSDQYTLGVILYECVTGQRPFAGDNLYGLLRAIHEGTYDLPRKLRPDLPERFQAIIQRAMSVAPEQRYDSVDALARDLLAFADARTRLTWEPLLGPSAGTEPVSDPALDRTSLPGPSSVSVPSASVSSPNTLSETGREVPRLSITVGGTRRSPVWLVAAVLIPLGTLGAGWALARAAGSHAAGAPASIHPTVTPMAARTVPVAPAAPVAGAEAVAPGSGSPTVAAGAHPVVAAPATSAAAQPAAAVTATPATGSHGHRPHHGHHAPASDEGGCRRLPNGAFDCGAH